MKLRSVHSLLLMFFFGIILSVSCKKDIKNESVPVSPGDLFPIPAATPVGGSVSGLIVDENNAPVEGAVAKLGTLSATTNARGIFSFNNATLDKYITTVTVEMPGYFKAYRSFSANATRNYVSIKLLPKIISGNVNSTVGGTVSLSNGTQLSFQANSVVIKSSGAAYSGNIKIYAAYIDPTASDISSTVPGSFMGRDDNNLYTLQSTGMIAVDLESGNGEALQLASNLPATIKMPIPASLLSKAPSNIDTWSLDEQGVWKKEGTAPRTGDFYEMQVTHFSFWNCDVSGNGVYLTLHIQDQNGNILPNQLVELRIPNNTSLWSAAYGYTDSLGNVSGLVPAAVSLSMNIISNLVTCYTIIYTQTIGPLATNSALTVTVTVPSNELYTISGTAIDCSGSPIQSGTAFIYSEPYGYYNTNIVNGAYTITLVRCGAIAQAEAMVVDYVTSSNGSSGLLAVSGNVITIPPVSACASGPAATFTFQDNSGSCEGSISGTYNVGTPLSGNNLISILVNVTTPGSYNIATAVVNGFSFSGTGTFNTAGQQLVNLVGSGTPTTGGSWLVIPQAAGVAGCSFPVEVNGPPASIDITSCPTVTVNGTYLVGTPLYSNSFPFGNSVSVVMNVLSPGNYHINTDNNDGFQFADSGYVATTGPVTFVLQGEGMPTISAIANFNIYSNGALTGCPFTVDIHPSSPSPNYSFAGAPGTCTLATPSGTLTAGTATDGSQGISIQVNVLTTGPWYVQASPVNGISFSNTGYFTTTGTQTIYLSASGTPLASGSYNFTPVDSQAGINGCGFTVSVN